MVSVGQLLKAAYLGPLLQGLLQSAVKMLVMAGVASKLNWGKMSFQDP